MGIINGTIGTPQAVTDPRMAGLTSDLGQSGQDTNPLMTSGPGASSLNAPITAPATSTVASPGATGVAQLTQPQAWSVTPDQTVEGRIQSIISAGSPLIQAARTNAQQGMNARGLVDSTMGQQASEAAAYSAALPIAQADAATTAKAASYNADEANQFGIQDVQAQNQRGLQQLTGQNQIQMQQLSNDNARLLQSNNQAATAFNQALVSMTAINSSTTMDANAKTQAIAQIQAQLQNQLKTLSATSGLNLTSQLNFAGYDGFDANGNYVGFGSDGATAGAPGAAPPPAPAPPAYGTPVASPVPGAPPAPAYGGGILSGNGTVSA